MEDDTESVEIECFSSSNYDLELQTIHNQILFHESTRISKVEFGNGIYVTKFTLEKLPCDSPLRRLSCNYYELNGDIIKSRYFVDIFCNKNMKKWSQWSNWTECHYIHQRVTRNRTDLRNPKTMQEQVKYCTCSDLVKSTGPR